MPEQSIHITPGPNFAVASAADDRPARWCFACKKHLPHRWTLVEDPPERQPSYYGAVPLLRCSRCHRDCTTFPGMEFDGPHYPNDAIWQQLVEEASKTRQMPEYRARLPKYHDVGDDG